jgi:hypothetical protein
MSKETFVAPMELKPGVTGADLEKFWAEEYLPNVSELPGYRVTLNKATFGKRMGQYLYLGHFESVERGVELFPVAGDATGSEEWQQWVAANPVFQKLMGFFDEKWYGEFTEYVEL